MSLLKIPHNKLRELALTVTQARVGLNRHGNSLCTKEILKFNLDHALARDAIYKNWNYQRILEQCKQKKIQTLTLKTQVQNRQDYLLNPPLGCVLHNDDSHFLSKQHEHFNNDLCLIVSDGLSATAIEDHFFSFIDSLLLKINELPLKISPIIFVPFARVAICDPIGEILKSKMSVIFIGERPGLSAHNSMGIYITPNPKIGCHNANRRCISNIRPPYGLSYSAGIYELLMLIKPKLLPSSFMD